MKNYWFYYQPEFNIINHNVKDFDYIDLDYYRYFKLNLSVYKQRKTNIPALIFTFILFGFGFEVLTHRVK